LSALSTLGTLGADSTTRRRSSRDGHSLKRSGGDDDRIYPHVLVDGLKRIAAGTLDGDGLDRIESISVGRSGNDDRADEITNCDYCFLLSKN
jgi:hypothetical protein